MVVVIPRDGKVFTDDITDELNAAFSSINEKIRNYKTEDLDYKEQVQQFSNSDSFKAGNVLSIRENFVVKEEHSQFDKVQALPVALPFEVWTKAITENNETLQVYINGSSIYVYGILSHYPQTAYISTDIVLPN